MVQRGTIIEQGSSLFISSVDLLQQFIGSAEMGDDDAASDDERDIEGFLLFFANGSEAIGLDDVVVDAIVAAQAGGDYQSHQLFVLGGDGAFEVGVVVYVVEALEEEVVGSVYVGVKAGAGVDEFAGDFAFFGNLLFGEEVGGFFAFGGHGEKG